MKSIVFAVLAFTALTFSSAEDDGQYRPELYGGDDGRYRPEHSDSGRYYGSGFGNYNAGNGKYASINAAYQPVFKAQYNPYQQLVSPVFGDQNSNDQFPFASAQSAVTASAASGVAARQGVYAPNHGYAKIIRQDQDVDANAYHYLYQTDNGINAEETGRIDDSANNGGTKATGFYEYVGDDGVKYRVDYVADENGFQPRGAHLPQA